jgi:hypothetical protein
MSDEIADPTSASRTIAHGVTLTFKRGQLLADLKDSQAAHHSDGESGQMTLDE